MSNLRDPIVRHTLNDAAITKHLSLDLNAKMKELRGKEERWAEITSGKERNEQKVNEDIELNIGGEVIHTTRAIVLSQPSYFSVLLQSGLYEVNHHITSISSHVTTDDIQHGFYIDRDPQLGAMIIQRLHGQSFDLRGLTLDRIGRLRDELRYYAIDDKVMSSHVSVCRY